MALFDLFQKLFVWGPYSRDEDAYHLEEAKAWTEALDQADDQVALSVDACFPDDSTLLDRWETIYDLHPASGDSESDRQAAVLEAFTRQPTMKPAYIAAQLKSLTGLIVTIAEFRAFHCDDPGSLVDQHCLEMQWTFYVVWDRDDAASVGLDSDLIDEQLLIDRLKPGHTTGIGCFGTFKCDDPYSLCDRDLLGA